MKLVSDVMSKKVITLHRDKLVCEAEVILCARKISGAPVVDDDGCVVGMISLADLNGFETTEEDNFYARIWEIASPNVVSIAPSATLSEAARLMIDNRIHRLLVTDGGNIAGILSTFDFMKLYAEDGASSRATVVRPYHLGMSTFLFNPIATGWHPKRKHLWGTVLCTIIPARRCKC